MNRLRTLFRLATVLLALSMASCGAGVQAKPLKVFILAGQSNMQGHAKVSTFEHIGMDPATKPMLVDMLAHAPIERFLEAMAGGLNGPAADANTTLTDLGQRIAHTR